MPGPLKKKRSEKRHATEIRRARFTPEEAAEFDAKAKDYGGDSAFIRNRTIGAPLPPRATNKGELARLRMEVAGLRAEMGKQGSNLNQLTKYANMDRVLEASIAEAAEDVKRGITTCDELRLAILQALGFERPRKPPKDSS